MITKGTTYAIVYAGGSGVYGGELGEHRLAMLLEKPYDCYVVTGPVMGYLPDEARKPICGTSSKVRASPCCTAWVMRTSLS